MTISREQRYIKDFRLIKSFDYDRLKNQKKRGKGVPKKYVKKSKKI